MAAGVSPPPALEDLRTVRAHRLHWQRGLVRETSLAADMNAPAQFPPAAVDFLCQNKDFAAHNFLQPEVGDVFDIKESFPI